jgi:hypothetical protein
MNKIFASAIAAILAIPAATVHAGGPIILEDETEVVAEKPASTMGILPLLLIPIILCVALCGGDDENSKYP